MAQMCAITKLTLIPQLLVLFLKAPEGQGELAGEDRGGKEAPEEIYLLYALVPVALEHKLEPAVAVAAVLIFVSALRPEAVEAAVGEALVQVVALVVPVGQVVLAGRATPALRQTQVR